MSQQNSEPVPPASTAPASSSAAFSMDSVTRNPKFIVTVKTFAIFGAILNAVNLAVSMAISSLNWSSYYNSFNIGALVMAIIAGAIGGAIGGAIFFYFYEPVRNWIKGNGFLSKHIYSLFTLFWKPFIVGTVISAAFGLLSLLGIGSFIVAITAGFGAVSVLNLLIGWAVSLAVHIGVYYWYSKTISAKLATNYPW